MVTRRSYVPERGDIVWLDFDPVRGHEQRGRRPALVLSPKRYNVKAGLALACPITSQVKGYPFEIECRTTAVQGVILADQIRSVDWKMRKAEKAGSASESVVTKVQENLKQIMFGVVK